MNPALEVLHVPGCPNVEPLLERLQPLARLISTTGR